MSAPMLLAEAPSATKTQVKPRTKAIEARKTRRVVPSGSAVPVWALSSETPEMNDR